MSPRGCLLSMAVFVLIVHFKFGRNVLLLHEYDMAHRHGVSTTGIPITHNNSNLPAHVRLRMASGGKLQTDDASDNKTHADQTKNTGRLAQ